jgi:prepilin-type processing-associated H-X9-DG protein
MPIDDYYAYMAGGGFPDLGGMFTCYGRPEASVPEPGNTIMMGCAALDPAVSTISNGTGVWSIRTMTLWGRRIRCNLAPLCQADAGDKYNSGIYLHSGGSNFGFADGHAKWMKLEKCYYPTNLFAAIQPNPGGPDPWGTLFYKYGYDPTAPWE